MLFFTLAFASPLVVFARGIEVGSSHHALLISFVLTPDKVELLHGSFHPQEYVQNHIFVEVALLAAVQTCCPKVRADILATT